MSDNVVFMFLLYRVNLLLRSVYRYKHPLHVLRSAAAQLLRH